MQARSLEGGSDLSIASVLAAILYKLKLNQSVTTIPTVGFNVETVTYKNVKCVWPASLSSPTVERAERTGEGRDTRLSRSLLRLLPPLFEQCELQCS